MAIRVKYEPAAVGLALASDLAGRGQLAKERQKFREQQRQFEEQLAEQQRQFDTGQEFRGQEFDEGVRRFDLGFDEGSRQFNVNKWLDSQRLLEGQRQYNLSLQERFAKDRKDRQMAIFQQEEADRRAMLAQQGAMARQGIQGQQAMEREQARSVSNMQRWHQDRLATQMNSDWKSLQDGIRQLTPEQQTEAVEKFEEKYRNSGMPMPFNLPESPPTPNEIAVQNHNAKMVEEGKEPGAYIDSNGDVGVYPWYAAELKDQSSENTRQKKNNKILFDLSNDQGGMGETAAGIDADLAEDERTAEAKLVKSGGRYDPQSGTWEWGTYGKVTDLDTSDPADADGNSVVTAEEYKAYYEDTGRTPQKPVHPISSSTYFAPRTLGEALDAMGDAIQEAGAREKLIQSHAEFESGLAELEAARGKAKREKQKAMRVWQNGVSEAIENGTVTMVVEPTKDGDPSIEEQLAEKRASGDPITRQIALVGPDGLPIKLFPYDSAPAAPMSGPPATRPTAVQATTPARPTVAPATTSAPAEEQEPVDRRTGEPPREAPEEEPESLPRPRGGEERYIRPLGHIIDPETGKPLKGRRFRLKENPTPTEIAAYDKEVEEAERQAGYSDDERERDLRKNIRPDRSRTEARRKRLEERDSLPFRGFNPLPGRAPAHAIRGIVPPTMGDIDPSKRGSMSAEERWEHGMRVEETDPNWGRQRYPKSVRDVLGQEYPDPIENRQVNVSREVAPAPGVRRGESEGKVRMSVVPQRVRVTPLQSKYDAFDAANKDMHDAYDRWGEVRETFEDLGILQGWTDKDIYEKIVMPFAGRATGGYSEALHIPKEDKVRMDKLKGKERKEAYRKYEKAIMDYIWFYPEVMRKTPAERTMDPSRQWMGNPDHDPFATDDPANEWFNKKYGRPSGNTFRSR